MSELPAPGSERVPPIVRVQTGARMEQRMVKVLKGLAEYLDLSLGDLLEGIVLHAFADRAPFSPQTLQRIEQLKQVYGMDYDLTVSHRLVEQEPAQAQLPGQKKGA